MIDNAPTIPKESAMSPEMTLVITYPIRGNNINVIVLEKVLAQFCPDFIRVKLTKYPNIIDKKHLNMK
tara:strand:+ start:324 stop:527 length:204 start_codon:yes stop_codon:yes gene_type:complete